MYGDWPGGSCWLIGKTCLKASPTTLRLESARSEHGWNVAESQPSVGSKLITETVRGAAPMPERPPDVTLVTVVSVIYPSFSFQNDCMKSCLSVHLQHQRRGSTYLEIIKDPWGYLIVSERAVIAAYHTSEAGSCHESAVLEG